MGGDFAGNYSWKYHPWVREMLDSKASFNYAMKGAQLGVTEVGINVAFYTIDRRRRNVLYVLPTSLNASDFSKSRFSPALALSPYLNSLFTDTNTVNLKQAGDVCLYIRGSRGDSNLKSVPASTLILDEVDEMEEKQITLALERLSGQLTKTVWGISTPTIPNYGIHRLYLDSTQEKFIFPCPCCSRRTELIWPDCIEIVGESISDPRCKESHLKCKECGGRLPHETKPDWLSRGHWEITNKNSDINVRGFHVSQLYSFTVTPGEIAVAHFRGFGNEPATKELHNSKLGLPYIGTNAQVSDEMLDECLRNYTTRDNRPKTFDEQIITMGVDQGKWNYASICAWTFPRFQYDLNAAASCKLLWFGTFPDSDFHNALNQLMREWQVGACVIDADPEINEARRFARNYQGFVWLCRYRKGQTAKEISISEEENGAPIATVDRTNWLSATLGRFMSQPRRIQLPADISLEYRDHIKAMVRTYDKDEFGNPVAVYKSVATDHYAHSLNYAEIALPLFASTSTGQDIDKFL